MIRSLTHLRTTPGRHDELARLFEALGVLVVSGDQPNLIAAELAVSEDDENEHLLIAEWPSAEHFERWAGGRLADDLLGRMQPLLEGEPETHLFRVVESIS